MEKFKPTYNLEEFKKSDFEITQTAQKSVENLGFEVSDIFKVVSIMEHKHFYKSMTFKNLFSTHPATEERIARLREQAQRLAVRN